MPQVPILDRWLTAWFRRDWRGFHRLHRAAVALGGNRTIVARTRFGAHLALDPTSYIDAIVLRSGYYEPEVMEALRPHLGPGKVFWDIGANFGLHALSAKAIDPSTEVIAFEPNSSMWPRLSENQRLCGHEISIQQCALGFVTGPSTLHVPSAGNPGMATLRPWPGSVFESEALVPCHRADELLTSGALPKPTAVKLDVEGFEYEVLAGFGEYLRDQGLRIVVFEADPDVANSATPDPIARLLKESGFTLRILPRSAESSHKLENFAAERLSA